MTKNSSVNNSKPYTGIRVELPDRNLVNSGRNFEGASRQKNGLSVPKQNTFVSSVTYFPNIDNGSFIEPSSRNSLAYGNSTREPSIFCHTEGNYMLTKSNAFNTSSNTSSATITTPTNGRKNCWDNLESYKTTHC